MKSNEKRNASGDLEAKNVFRNKRLLAELFGYLTEEFRGMDPAEIEKCIVTDENQEPMEFNTELFDPNAGSVRLDTIVEARVPDERGGRVRIRLNLEMQARTDTEYELTDRAQTYAAMMLATQNKESVGGRKYLDLRRCYSVWVCPRPSGELDGNVFDYGMRPSHEWNTSPKFESLMDIIMIFPGRSEERQDRSVTDMLSLVFSKGLEPDRCHELLNAKYKIDIDLSSLGMIKMTDWVTEAKEDGIIEGRIRKSAEDIITIMDRYGETLENALVVMKVSDEDRDAVLKLVKELQAS